MLVKALTEIGGRRLLSQRKSWTTKSLKQTPGQACMSHFPMIPLGSVGLLPVLSLYMGALLSSDAFSVCPHPPCRDSLVAAPIQPGMGAGTGTRACEGQTGTTACRVGFALPAISEVHRRVEHRPNFPQVQPKVSDITYSLVVCHVLFFKKI